MASAVSATLVLLFFVLPGAVFGPLILPGAPTPLAHIARAVGLSLVIGMTLCLALAALGLLTGPALALSLLTTSAVGVMVGRSRIRVPGPRARRWWAGGVAGTVVAIVLVVAPSRAAVGSDLLPLTSTTWYYANLAQSMAALGRIPSGVAEWGSIRPFQTDYLPATAHAAGAMLLLPGDLLTDLEIYRLAILGIGLLLGVALLRRWFSSWVALLGAILLFSTILVANKFDGYRPETVAFDLLLFTVWLADRAIVERSRRIAALAVVSSALAFLSHAEVFLVLIAALAGIGIARATVAADGSNRDRLGLRIPIGRTAVRASVLTIGVVLGGVILGSFTALATTGEAGVFAYLRGSVDHTSAVVARPEALEIPAGWTFSGDPTWDFYVAAAAPNYMGGPPPDSFTDSRLLPRTILRVWTGADGRNRLGLAALIGLCSAPLVAWPWLDARRRRAIVASFVFGGLIVIGSYLVFAISDTYVPQRTGGVRLMPYLLLIPVLSATLLLWAVGRLLVSGPFDGVARSWRLAGRTGRASLAALALLTVWAISGAIPIGGRTAALTPLGYDAFQWMRQQLPPDARLLANAYTDGSIAAVTGRVGIIDGRAVYLEEPEFLAESTALCLGARVVFADPTAPGALTFLARERVDYLIISTAGPSGRDVGGYPIFPTNTAALASSPAFRLTRSFGDGRLLLYEVVGT
jgi:hypothetical protein